MICPPCAQAADADQYAAEVYLTGGHDPTVCRDPATCACQHGPTGTATETTDVH